MNYLPFTSLFLQCQKKGMEIYSDDGECLIQCQMKADAQTDDLVADINNKINKAHDEESV